ncbi:P-loop containing nucleoside triphosphate hydrolase protein [Sparassis crispa]|uniref:Signal recognition particle receptor subunit beta n=1 Tax=Sparassis crispa TaxID=139825 RepID=A0A401GIX6_9APHY|nr:P-loop containing nucleoside triphosphate hydrolase protein [Sparassis crispa]GBE82108.1 P-loop containing nucleoside triphosphate hydrolase protein [Sparassis crispa]
MDDSTPHEFVSVAPEVLSPASVFTAQTVTVASLCLALFLLAVFIVSTKRKAGSKGDSLLLVGSSDAGKTAILSTLVYKQTLHTHTSMQTNSAVTTLPVSHKALRVIDVPGHPRLRDQFQEYLPEAKAVAFVVDASTISRTGPAVAEHLHQVLRALTSLPPSQTPPALLIVAHKCDLLKATHQTSPEQLAINRVRTVLERELEKRRASHASGVGVESLGADDTESEMGGLECSESGEFRFAEWEGGEVAFVGTAVPVSKVASATDEKIAEDEHMLQLRQWLEEL